jgi:glucosamine--fructose-6-phosphate aminotransferase (isomerizing)
MICLLRSLQTGLLFCDHFSAPRIIVVACGTSFHAGMVGRSMIEELVHIPIEVILILILILIFILNKCSVWIDFNHSHFFHQSIMQVEYASEFRYRKPVLEPGCVVIAVSQSGETADTLAAIKLAKGSTNH